MMSLPPGPDLEAYSDEELEEERDFLLTSLADLDAEREAGDVDEHDFEALRDGYTARAASVLRILDRRRVDAELSVRRPSRPEGRPSRPEARPPGAEPEPDPEASARKAPGAAPAPVAASAPEGSVGKAPGAAPATVAVSDATAVSAVAEAPALDGLGAPAARRTARPAERGAKPRPRWRTPAIIGAVAAFAVIAGVLVARASGQRLPGNSLTGTVPNNKIDQELVLAVQQFQKGDAIDAIKTYDQILSVQPTNVEALTYKGWLLRLAGSQAGNTQLIDEGFSSIQEAERVDPSYPDPHFFAGEILLRDKNDPKDAITEFQTYLADNPPSDMGPEVQGEIQAAEAELTGKPQAGETTASTTTVPN